MMLKLTLIEWNSQTAGDIVYVNPSHIYHIKPFPDGSYVHLGPASTGHGFWVKESAEEVARMVDEAKGPSEFRSTEREDVIRQLREVCGDYGDNDWPDNLHLGDVIEKHLARHLYSEEE